MRIEPVELRAGDILVVSTQAVLTKLECAEVKVRIQEQFPEYRIVLLTQGVTLSVLRAVA